MSEFTRRARERLTARGAKLPSERDWERSAVLEPRIRASRHADLISDGGGLSFPPAALHEPPSGLDPEDPAASALLTQLGVAAKRPPTAPWNRSGAPAPAAPSLDGWRVLARTENEVLFGHGSPPQLLTVGLRRDGRRGRWAHVGSGAARPLRAVRDGIRASSWRVDPTREFTSEDTVLRVLVTEQAHAGGQRAKGRVLAPDLHADPEELILTFFVRPLPGSQSRAPNPETPVRIALPEPVGSRRLIDGALEHG